MVNPKCIFGIPCTYTNEVDLRVIVMVFNRPQSLEAVLNSISKLELDGDKASLEIWIDVTKNGTVDYKTLSVAKNFIWRGNTVNIHVQSQNAGILGQWINSWRPNERSTELAIILEDDVDLSPYAYRWLKAAHTFYSYRSDMAGISLFEGSIPGWKQFPSTTAFFLRRFGTQGFAPNPCHWRKFQDWYHQVKSDPQFHPYVEDDKICTEWYKDFERAKRQSSMWEMWYIRYGDDNTLWTLFSNIGAFEHARNASIPPDTYLAYHRQANGLHFHGHERESTGKLLLNWQADYMDFSRNIPHYFYDNRKVAGNYT